MAHPHLPQEPEHGHSMLEIGIAGAAVGLAGGAIYAHYNATTATASAVATVCGVKVGIFILACGVVGAALFLLIAAIDSYRRRADCYPGFFSCCRPAAYVNVKQAAVVPQP